MSSKYKYLLLSTCFSAIGFVSFSAHAGFEWTPPEKEVNIERKIEKPLIADIEDEGNIRIPVKSNAIVTPDIIEQVVIEEIIINDEIIEEEDVIIEESEINLFPLNDGDKVVISDSDTVILSSDMDNTVNIKSTATDKITWNKNETFNVIDGFGADMPLALALRQIVPAKYAFSFGNNVNPGETISWNGGKPWNEVLKDSLSPLNIDFKVKENKVILTSDVVSTNTVIEKKPKAVEKKEDSVIADKKKPKVKIEPIKEKSPTIVEDINKVIAPDPLPATVEVEAPSDEAVIKRTSLLDPGKSENKQPDLLKTNNISEEIAPKDTLEDQIKDTHIQSDIINEIPVVDKVAIIPEVADDILIIEDVSPQEEEGKIVWNNVEEAPALEVVNADEIINTPELSKAPSNNTIVWEADRGTNLRLLLTKWCKEENIKFVWDTDESYKLDKDIFISGTFKSAIEIVFSKGLEDAPLYSLPENGTYELRVSD